MTKDETDSSSEADAQYTVLFHLREIAQCEVNVIDVLLNHEGATTLFGRSPLSREDILECEGHLAQLADQRERLRVFHRRLHRRVWWTSLFGRRRRGLSLMTDRGFHPSMKGGQNG